MRHIRQFVNRIAAGAAVAAVLAVFSGAALGQVTASRIVPAEMSQAEIDRMVAKFTANEKAFREALTNYVFNREATIQTIGMGGQITGVYRRDSFMTFTTAGERFERITFFPVSTLTEIGITPEDLEDLGGVNPFALEPDSIPQYNFTYLGKEKIDELNLHVFEVSPKVVPNPKRTKQRVFTGRIWVDDQDLMIVKSKGKALPETKDNKFPVVETWRENVDGKYWFPVYASADDELVFDNGHAVRIRMRVKYKDYAVGRTDVKVIDEEEDYVEPKPSPTPRKP